VTEARYDGLAEWFDREFATGPRAIAPREAILRLMGDGHGALLDVGCGTGAFSAALAELGWSVTGVDISEDQLRLARRRGVTVIHTDATSLPFGDSTFDAAVSSWTHTDVDDFAAMLGEVARVLRPGARFVYLGAHPCFVGPHSTFVAGEGEPELHAGYRETVRYTAAPGPSSESIRAKVGATHLPLGLFMNAFVAAGFRLDWFEEPENRAYPYMVALRWLR
jgi:SAM-dependent methyltransferase